MKKTYKLAIFDLDGTVLDTLLDLAAAVNFALQKNGYPTRTVEEVCSFVGNGIKRLIDRAVPTGTAEAAIAAVFADFKAYYALHCADKTAPYEGVIEMLTALRATGMKTAVLSNKADFATQALCKTYFSGLFDLVAGEREDAGVRKKPAPDAAFAMMSALAVTPAETVYIGDSEVDLLTAKNAGVDAVSVSWGFRPSEFLRQSGASVIADTPQQLTEILLT